MAVPSRDPVADLRRIAFLLERAHEATYRVRAFRGAATSLAGIAAADLAARAAAGTLTEISGVGAVTARCVAESLAGEEPVYLRRLESTAGTDLDEATAALRAALRGDCHSHSDWSDGGSPIEEMVAAAIDLGHQYLVLTDHSPRLTVARGLTADRLRKQLEVVAAINDQLATLAREGVLTRAGGSPRESGAGESGAARESGAAGEGGAARESGAAGEGGAAQPFRLLSGIEVDILADGSLDQDDDLLASLDIVVGSVHSGLRDDAGQMTRRMVAALENPLLDILGHCTGRLLPRAAQPTAGAADDSPDAAAKERGGRGGERGRRGGGRGRPESTFDADAVFAAAVAHDKAIEINSRPERLDPPKRLLRRALEAGCRFAIDTDAHAPGQLDWQRFGCVRAVACGIPTERIVNTWSIETLLAWSEAHQRA